MKKKYLLGALAIAVVLIAGYLKRKFPKVDLAEWTEKIRQENQPLMDSIQHAHYLDNLLRAKINRSIEAEDFHTAYTLMDSLKGYDKEYTVLFYEGMILEKQKKYNEAIEKYTTIINQRSLPGTLDKRARIYIKQNKLALALEDYMTAYRKNFDFSLEVASTFERMGQKDSALKYYKIYISHYPDDTTVVKKVNLLK